MSFHHIANRSKKLPPLRVGIGGPVGSGKTTLLEMLCKGMKAKYDLVAIIEAPDDESATAFSLAIAAAGNIRIQTLRAFNKGEMNGILARMA